MKKIIFLLFALLALSACRDTAMPAESASPLKSEQQSSTPWQEDLDVLVTTIRSNHPSLLDDSLKDSFLKEAQKIRETLSDENDTKSMIELMRLAASVGDAHTYLSPKETAFYGVNFLWFKEGLFLIVSSDEAKEHLGKRLVAVDGNPVEEVIAKLKTIVSHENEQWLKSEIRALLRNSQILYELSIADKPEELTLSLEDVNGGISYVKITAIQSNQQSNIQYQALESINNKYPTNYIKDTLLYWYQYMEEQQILYIQYNRCRNSKEQSVEEFINEIKTTIENNPIRKIIIDLRNNSGGNSILIRSLMSYIVSKELNHPEQLFVFIGKGTFSSGMENAIEFRDWNNATLVGEPTGGKPNSYGNTVSFQLPHSKLQGQYSTRYFINEKGNDQLSVFPDILIEPSIQEWREGRDFCLEYVIQAEMALRE
ncbi:MAG: peptidase [Paenibacillaceae bacterium]|jgi:C-terminal processing protease CtpA/Prc|nr:peptidase [Paenibacillaceae bacterium]